MEFKRIVNLDLSDHKGLFLFGSRQTGKSYWLNKKFPHYKCYDLLKSDLFFKFSRSPHLLREELLVAQPKQPVIIDEIQKIPPLLDEIHYLMEKHRILFILTGSSSRKLKKEGVNLLGGRALYKKLFPLVSSEIPQFNLLKIMQFGSLPAVYKSKHPKFLLKSYVNTYLKEEIQMEGWVRNLQPFSLFLDLASQTNAQLINYSNIASDIGVSSNTVREYYSILEDTLIGYLLPPYKKTIKRKPVSISKFYFFDIGVKNTLINQWSITEETTEFGNCFEHFIFNEINAYLHYNEDDRQLRFWRSKNHQEVDFIIGDHTAIEVKASKKIHVRDLKGLKTLSEEVNLKHKIVVSLEKVPRLIDQQFLILPYRDFLKQLWDHAF